MSQGIQWYFCSEERMSFVEILFQIFGIVTDSDLKFG
jgi:hypothetical protein